MPKALDRLIVTRRPGTRHTFSKTVFFNQLLGFLCGVLAPSITVVHSVRRAFGVSSHCHFKCLLNNILTLVSLDRPTNQPSCGNVNHTASIDLIALTDKFSYIRTPKVVWNCNLKLVFDQIFFDILFLCWFRSPSVTRSAAFSRQFVFPQNARNLIFTYNDSVS